MPEETKRIKFFIRFFLPFSLSDGVCDLFQTVSAEIFDESHTDKSTIKDGKELKG